MASCRTNASSTARSRISRDRYHIPASGGFPLWENPDYVNDLVEAWLGNFQKIEPIFKFKKRICFHFFV